VGEGRLIEDLQADRQARAGKLIVEGPAGYALKK
jgi:hypothetical protein